MYLPFVGFICIMSPRANMATFPNCMSFCVISLSLRSILYSMSASTREISSMIRTFMFLYKALNKSRFLSLSDLYPDSNVKENKVWSVCPPMFEAAAPVYALRTT